MPRSGLKPLLVGVLALLLLLSAPLEVAALPSWLSRDPAQQQPIPSQGPSGRLQDLAPPGAVQQLKHQLASRQPQLNLVSPADDNVVKSDAVELVLDVQDWPVSRDPDLGIGPHVAVQVDDRPLIRLDQLTNGKLRLQLDDQRRGAIVSAPGPPIPGGKR